MKGATSIQERLWELRKDKGLNLEDGRWLKGARRYFLQPFADSGGAVNGGAYNMVLCAAVCAWMKGTSARR